ncbi:PUS1 [Enterospora canceri]|uniref:tRNA pseudouridine synthase n=1 Tax=Enterospora canceri TaxID=1081671 RepID=A0A1Y1S7I4_9MICR|nr:PUS1 [Enterospora canceri]
MKRKIALIWGYSGVGYAGLQFNKDSNTLERRIIGVLAGLGYISEANSESATKVHMKSASRTDKGVGAVFNVTTMKINTELTDTVFEKIEHEFSLNNFVLYKVCQVPRGFVAHKQARNRSYKYFIPTKFMETCNLGSEKELLNDQTENGTEKRCKELFRVFTSEDVSFCRGFRVEQEQIDKMGRILKLYEGTRDYHNFTTSQNKQGTKRHLRRVRSLGTRVVDDVEYLEVSLSGDSFILHQIRKMVAFALFNCRYVVDFTKVEENYEKVFSETKYVLGKAPAPYLYLFDIGFRDYNERTEYGRLEAPEERRDGFEIEMHKSIFTTDNLKEWLIHLATVQFRADSLNEFV